MPQCSDEAIARALRRHTARWGHFVNVAQSTEIDASQGEETGLSHR